MGVIEIRPSRRLVLFLAGGHGVTAFSCLYLPQGWPVWLGLAIVGASLIHALRAARRIPLTMLPGKAGVLCLAPGEAGEHSVTITSSSTLSPAAVWLVWKDERARGRSGAVLLLRDQMSTHAWRSLQIWLRLQVGVPEVKAGDA